MTHDGLIDVHQHLIPQVYIDRLATVGMMGSGEHPGPAAVWARHWRMGRSGITTR